MRRKINNNVPAISWVGKQYEPERTDTGIAFKNKNKYFYRKCIFGALTLEIGNYVLVSNFDKADPGTINGCDIARIEHMYEILDDKKSGDIFKATVQWYSKPAGLPRSIEKDENYAFDKDYEVIEDSRFEPNISIDSIFNHCRVEIVETDVDISQLVAKKATKLPMFVARYRLAKISGSRKFHLEPLKNAATELTPRKRKSIAGLTGRSVGKSASKEVQKTPKLKIEFVNVDAIEDDYQVLQNISNEGTWVVKAIDNVDRSVYKQNLVQVTERLGDVEISDEESLSPKKMARMNQARRKSGNFRRNLNDSLRGGSPTSEEDVLNYSIVKDDSKGTEMKIRLKLSERHKSECETPTRKSIRKRTTPEKVDFLDNETSPRKSRKPDDVESSQTPTTRPRRKSILKTPSTKTGEVIGTPKRLQLSNIVEEFTEGRRMSRKITQTPTKAECIVDEPKTPRSRTNNKTTSQTSSAAKSKLIRSGAIKPTIHNRAAPLEVALDSQLAMARERLHVSAVPTSLPCREKEYNEIYNFVEGKIIDGCGGCMYVSGVPGTGKTATTTAVIRSLQASAEEEDIPKFEFVEINGMRLTEPRQAYVHIYRQLTGKTLAWEQAYNLLEKRFTTKAPRRVTTVLLVDELDILCNRRQDVVYNLLNWPTLPSAQLVVITIANTMDLPERLLMGKISSRLGLTRLTFQPYNFRQLQEIVMARLIGTSAFDAEAVQLVARKVAAVSGDARRALDICRRATEIADDKSKQTGQFVSVSMIHVQQALGEMIASAKVQTIKSCSKLEQLFLQAVTSEVTRTGIEECCFLGVYSQFETLAAINDIRVPNPGRAIAICSRLGASRLLICENSRNDIYQKILLNISADDVHFALQASKLI
ncbi:origin recognition complex subunit 1 [Aedes aegypti]|uniref:Origin recognition complex subunit 1 n=1 Tax=Aedes aegypti TaxID=7159 RepID=A0A6I8U6V0_AEDAE|nr:origin recognition complex subunit 1 [Aedes aegypti]